jgi:hypothetical protein
MEQQQAQQVEQQLRQNWRQLRYRILDQFAQVSTSDLDASTNVNDLVQRIADRTHHSERYVETRLQELVGVGAGQAQAGQGQIGQQTAQSFSQGQQQQPQGMQPQGQPFGQSGQS